jgi:hypothetical protein
MHLRPTESTIEKKVQKKEGSLKDNNLKPEEMVSTNQYISKELGQLPHTRRKESEKSVLLVVRFTAMRRADLSLHNIKFLLVQRKQFVENIYLNGKQALAELPFVTIVAIMVSIGRKSLQETLPIETKRFDSQEWALIIRTELPKGRSK